MEKEMDNGLPEIISVECLRVPPKSLKPEEIDQKYELPYQNQ
jgi:hypothetical protein